MYIHRIKYNYYKEFEYTDKPHYVENFSAYDIFMNYIFSIKIIIKSLLYIQPHLTFKEIKDMETLHIEFYF